MSQSANLELVPVVRAPRAARAFVAETLAAWDIQAEEVEALQLVVSELVTNAVLHAPKSRRIGVELFWDENGVRVNVSDESSNEPTRRGPDQSLPEEGRGVQLVDAIADRWGTERRGWDGKTVWCEVRTKAATGR
ncbi:MAG TPA: ATP-binding protein [Acidimicrobiia bacterium]|nr:ATP-binding protein [Acidimicrobiia bacterium]